MRILHLTDLHVGMSSQEWLWPAAKKGVLEDLARLHDKVGGLDLVIFSGDLTQKAAGDEYTKLNDVLGEVWKALSAKRAIWLVSDWGLGDEQFIRTLQSNQPVEQSFVYELDCQNFHKRDDIYAGVQEQTGCSFEQMCEQISLEGPCFLVLDDVPILEGSDKVAHQLQGDIEFISEILLQYCHDVRLIVKSRRPPEHCALSVIELRPFDEADTMAYVVGHEHGGRDLATTKFVGQLFRHTDGIPTRIDRALRDVQIVGVNYLYVEDLQRLLGACHEALWRAFEGRKEIENLLRLFRYSSLRWRVRGLDTTETSYIARLSRALGDRTYGDFGRTSRELAYFLARNGQVVRSAKDSQL